MPELKTVVLETPFLAEVADQSGKISSQNMNLRVIQVQRNATTAKGSKEAKSEAAPEPAIETIKRQTQQGERTSNITPLEGAQNSYQNIIDPPYDQFSLVLLEEESNILRECIDSMVTNIEGYGNVFRPRKLEEAAKKKHQPEVDIERIKLEGWLGVLCPEISFVETRKRMRRDLELTGNGYWEVVRDGDRVIIEINHVASHRMRLTKLDEESTPYKVPVISPEDDYQIKQIDKRRRFRRFVQIDSYGKPKTFFKEFNDERHIDKNTGEVASDDLAITDEATEIIHFKIYSARSVYGIPRYISRFVSIIGSRRAEEVNFFTLSNNYIPSMFIMVENGSLTPASIQRLTELIETQVGSDPNYSKVVILEAEAGEAENFSGQITNAKLNIHEPKNQKTDEMFQSYDKNNQDKVRQSFRLAPLLVGRSEDYTRATAQASIRVGDEQVFSPEREVVDSQVIRIMLDQGIRWHFFRSRTPNITDNEVLAKAMVAAERSGAMTPRRSNTLLEDIFEGELGPMPEGIPLDTPYSLTFALAQTNTVTAPSEMSEGQVGTVERSGDWVPEYIDELLNGLHKQVDPGQEFDRFLR